MFKLPGLAICNSVIKTIFVLMFQANVGSAGYAEAISK